MDLRNILFIFPVMGYFLLEAVVLAIFVNFVWRFVLEPWCGVAINYLQWIAIIWIIKVLFFNVFNLLSGIGAPPPEYYDEKQENQ